jgi:hypothetical protein
MKKYFLLLIVSLLFTSCKSYIQIYDVDSTSAKTSNEQFVFENEDCKLTYNFWEEWGNASMIFTNKTDKNLFVSLSQSSYIFNGFSSSFYKGVDDHVVISKFESKTFHDLPVVCVAPKSSRVIGGVNLVDKIYFFCEKKKDKPNRRYSEDYNENNSPIKFGYNMVYSAKENCNEVKSLESSFYISRIENVIKKQEEVSSQVKDCLDYSETSVITLKSQSPKRFYIKRFKDVNPTPERKY